MVTNCKKVHSNPENVRNLLNKIFASEPAFGDNDKYIKIKTKIYDR